MEKSPLTICFHVESLLDVVHLSRQVGKMKQELEQASHDSRQLTDKLRRLEDENRQLGAVVSRLGGGDARRLKAQVLAPEHTYHWEYWPTNLLQNFTADQNFVIRYCRWNTASIYKNMSLECSADFGIVH